MAKLRSLTDIKDLSEKTVLVRADLDVPVAGGEVTNNFRLRALVPTLKHLIDNKARVVVIGHLGRPEGQFNDEMSLMPVRFELGKLLNMHIKFAHLPNSRNSIRYLEPGEVLMLENLRFHPEEENDDPAVRKNFMAEIAGLADYYVNDAFASYRVNASTYELAQAFKAPVAGIQLQREIEQISKLKDNFKSPYVVVVGGAKVSTKVELLEDLVTKADTILIGGAMAYAFLQAQGIEVGESKIEASDVKLAKKVLNAAKKSGCKIMLPIDHKAAKEFSSKAKPVEVETQQIPKDLIGLDIGERTMASYLEVIKGAETLLWNGPMGVFEWPAFSRGTEAIGEYIALSASDDAFKVAGGGDTIAAMDALKINMRNYDHVSTGGGALMAYLAGEEMPTIEVLYSKK